MSIRELPTPTLLVEKSRLAANTEAMRRRMDSHGILLRPHCKTAKSVHVAKMASGGSTGPITVSTIAEADYFLDHGFTDITYAVCMAPGKLDAVAALRRKGASLKIIIDSADAADAVRAHPLDHEVLIEIDCGEHRTGVDAESDALLEIAHRLGAGQVSGVLTHAGHSYASRSAEEAAGIAETERKAAVNAAERLRGNGFETPIVSVGSTPTATHARTLEGVTEARPGVYVFNDLFQAGIGSCGVGDIALTVLATVIAHNPPRRSLMLDAGGLALSKDRSTAALDADGDCGYGLLCDVNGRPLPGMTINSVHQEHGEVHVPDPSIYDSLPIGARVRVLPNHACMTAAAYGCYHVVDGDDEVIEIWERCNGW